MCSIWLCADAAPCPSTSAGTLHLGILIENMRREGYEFEIGPPRVITKEIDGVKMEPFEEVSCAGTAGAAATAGAVCCRWSRIVPQCAALRHVCLSSHSSAACSARLFPALSMCSHSPPLSPSHAGYRGGA